MLTVLLGGARSGKSSLAVRLGQRHTDEVIYLATSPRIPGDHDLDDRIAVHQAERPPEWRTIEAETDLAGAIAAAGAALVIIDCLTVWTGNLVHHGSDDDQVSAASRAALDVIAARAGDTIAISNEVGLGIVPDNALARRYRDLLGRVNQAWVAAADRSLLVVAGRAIELSDPDGFV